MTHEATTLTQDKAARPVESSNNASSSFASYGAKKPGGSGIDTPAPCMFFLKVSADVRFRIHEELLITTPSCIHNVDKLVGAKCSTSGDRAPVPDTDGTILRTCRTTYDEAWPML